MVLRLRDEALKKSQSVGGKRRVLRRVRGRILGGGGAAPKDGGVSAGGCPRALGDAADAPPRGAPRGGERRSRGRGENARLEGEIAELRAVRTEESEVTARAIESATRRRRRNAELAAPRGTPPSASRAESAERPRRRGGEGERGGGAGRRRSDQESPPRKTPPEHALDVRGTEGGHGTMFGQIETLDALRERNSRANLSPQAPRRKPRA